MACAGGQPPLPNDNVPSFQTPEDCTDVCPDTVPDWENQALCDKEAMDGCFCTYPDMVSACFLDCFFDGNWAMACAEDNGDYKISGNWGDNTSNSPSDDGGDTTSENGVDTSSK